MCWQASGGLVRKGTPAKRVAVHLRVLDDADTESGRERAVVHVVHEGQAVVLPFQHAVPAAVVRVGAPELHHRLLRRPHGHAQSTLRVHQSTAQVPFDVRLQPRTRTRMRPLLDQRRGAAAAVLAEQSRAGVVWGGPGGPTEAAWQPEARNVKRARGDVRNIRDFGNSGVVEILAEVVPQPKLARFFNYVANRQTGAPPQVDQLGGARGQALLDDP